MRSISVFTKIKANIQYSLIVFTVKFAKLIIQIKPIKYKKKRKTDKQNSLPKYLLKTRTKKNHN